MIGLFRRDWAMQILLLPWTTTVREAHLKHETPGSGTAPRSDQAQLPTSALAGKAPRGRRSRSAGFVVSRPGYATCSFGSVLTAIIVSCIGFPCIQFGACLDELGLGLV